MSIGSLYVLAVAPIIWVSRSITIYSKLLLSHFILFRNKHILIVILKTLHKIDFVYSIEFID